MLSDLESLERRIVAARKKAQGKDKEALAQVPVMKAALAKLQNGEPARTLSTLDADDRQQLRNLNLLTSKPVLYVCNVAEADAATATGIRRPSPRWPSARARAAS